MLKLLKLGIWEDALIAFSFMKDWTIEDARENFKLIEGSKLNLVKSGHISKYIKLNDNLYIIPGGDWSIRFHESIGNLSTKDYIEI